MTIGTYRRPRHTPLHRCTTRQCSANPHASWCPQSAGRLGEARAAQPAIAKLDEPLVSIPYAPWTSGWVLLPEAVGRVADAIAGPLPPPAPQSDADYARGLGFVYDDEDAYWFKNGARIVYHQLLCAPEHKWRVLRDGVQGRTKHATLRAAVDAAEEAMRGVMG